MATLFELEVPTNMMDKCENYTRNRLANLLLRRMKSYGSLCKVLHADPEIIDITPDNDLVFFVLYSLNKHRRWEVCDQVGEPFLDHLYELNDRTETMILDRCFVEAFRAHWAHIVPHFFHVIDGAKIRNSYEKRGSYSERHFKGVGRYYGDDEKKQKEEPTTVKVVTYNIVRAPDNYKKYFARDFRNYPRLKGCTYRRKGQYDPRTVNIDWGEYMADDVDDDVAEDVVRDSDDLPRIRKFYDLSEHLVSSPHRRKTKRDTVTDDGFVYIQ